MLRKSEMWALVAAVTLGLPACESASAPRPRPTKLWFTTACGDMQQKSPTGDSAMMSARSALSSVKTSRSLSPATPPSRGFGESDECVSAQTVSEDTQLLDETPQAPPPNADIWYGEDIGWPDEGAGLPCPETLRGLNFNEYVPETGETAKFSVVALPGESILKVQELGYDMFGFAMARYRLPENLYNSKNGNYSIYGGYVSVTCYLATIGVGRLPLRVELGLLRAWNYDGFYGQGNPIRINRTSLSGGGDDGWAFEDSQSGFQNGFGDGWHTALTNFIGNGVCTAGWTIFVDGNEVCDRYGNRVNQT
jgi:hypothetical protein